VQASAKSRAKSCQCKRTFINRPSKKGAKRKLSFSRVFSSTDEVEKSGISGELIGGIIAGILVPML
jgi:hypothetical protein